MVAKGVIVVRECARVFVVGTEVVRAIGVAVEVVAVLDLGSLASSVLLLPLAMLL